MTELSRRFVGHPAFNQVIMGVILLAGAVVGLQTYGPQLGPLYSWLYFIDKIILAIFTAEVALRMASESPKPQRYFGDPWNIFDFVIVAVSLVALLFPNFDGAFVAVFRLVRVLRVFRIVRTVPKLQLMVNVLIKSVPSIGHVALLLSVIFYIYATMGVFLFKVNDPLHFGTLGLSLVSLFRVVTLEDWTDIMYINIHGCDHPIWGYGPEMGCLTPTPMGGISMAFFISFVLIGTMIVLNLFIGVIMNSMEEAKLDAQIQFEDSLAEQPTISAEDELQHLSNQLGTIQKELNTVLHRLKMQSQLPKTEPVVLPESESDHKHLLPS